VVIGAFYMRLMRSGGRRTKFVTRRIVNEWGLTPFAAVLAHFIEPGPFL